MYHIHDYHPPVGWAQHTTLVIANTPAIASIHRSYGPFESRDDAIAQIGKLFGEDGFHERRANEFFPGPVVKLSARETFNKGMLAIPDVADSVYGRDNHEGASTMYQAGIAELQEMARLNGWSYHAGAWSMMVDHAWWARTSFHNTSPGVSFWDPEDKEELLSLVDKGDRPMLLGKKPWTSRARGQAMHNLIDRAYDLGFFVLMRNQHILFSQFAGVMGDVA